MAMDAATNDDSKLPIPLRLPASLLSTLSKDSRLHIDRGTNASGLMSLTIASANQPNNSNHNDNSRCYQLERADDENNIDWYRPSTASGIGPTQPQVDLQYIETTCVQYTLQPKSKADLKEIGKRTRQLLEDERRKRKEIVRLDDDKLLPPTRKAAPVADAGGEMPSKRRGAAKNANARNANARKRRRRVASNVDGWMPNVDDLLPGDAAETAATNDASIRSNVVRLHGLPMNVKPEQVRKFLHGLRPSSIFVLPTFGDHIQGWDAAYSASGDENGRPKVERHASDFRVFVKFASAPVANLAIGRSGECIGLDSGGTGGGESEFVGASVSLTPVPKHVATFLQKHMAIQTLKGESIVETMARTEEKLGKSVICIAWEMATKKLNLERQIIRKGNGGGGDTRHLGYLTGMRTMPTNKQQWNNLAKTYNQLIDAQERLEADFSLLFTHQFDPSCARDSVHRVTHSVSDWLLDEIVSVGRLLKPSTKS